MRLVEEARQRHGEADSVPAMVLVAGFVPRLCDALEEAERERERLRQERDTFAARCNGLDEQLTEIAAEMQARSWRGDA